MDSYPPFTEFPHIFPVSRTASQSYDAFDPLLSTDHQLGTQASQFQFHLTSSFDQSKAHDASTTTQSWWRGDTPSINTSCIAPQFPVSADRFEPWNSEISTISDPQSPSSSHGGSLPGMNCIASPRFCHDELPMTTVDEQAGYPAPGALVDIDHTPFLSQPGVFEVLPDHRSSFETDLDPWSGSQSDRNGTPEQQWPSPLPTEAMTFPQTQRRSKTRPAPKSRIRKPTEPRTSSTTARNGRRRRVTTTSDGENGAPRIFTCSFAPYGCQSTFVSKNEWKRHVTSQHLQLGFYRCDVGKCSIHSQSATSNQYLTPSTSPRSRTSSPPPGLPNDFNRKDLFTQHQRRMHAPWLEGGRRRKPTDAENATFEAGLEEVRRRCWHALRTLPQQSHCGFCREVFSGEGSWDARMEHVGRHFEREDRQALGAEDEDVALREWGLREGILTLVDGGRCRLASLVGDEI